MALPNDGDPAAPRPAAASRFRSALNRWLAGPPPSDPLYLSNRTFLQRARIWLIIAIPCCLAIAIVIGVNRWRGSESPPPPEPSNAEIAARMLPNLDGIRLPGNHEIELLEAQVTSGAAVRLSGSLRNKTARPFRVVEVVFDVTDVQGSHLGAVSAKLQDLAAGASARFEIPLAQRTAAFAIVRDIQAH